MQGTLEGMEIDRSAHLALDEEGSARRYDSQDALSLDRGISLLMLAAASRPVRRTWDLTDAAGDRACAQERCFRLTSRGLAHFVGRALSAVSHGIRALEPHKSIYFQFSFAGQSMMTLPENTPLEIGFRAGGRQDGKKSSPQAITAATWPLIAKILAN